jgi:hypothetical protein
MFMSDNTIMCEQIQSTNTIQRNYKYCCDKCKYNTDSKKDLLKNNLTRKHTLSNHFQNQIVENPKSYNCNCGKKYKHRQSLYTHKKECNQVVNGNTQEITSDVSNKIAYLQTKIAECHTNVLNQYTKMIEYQALLLELSNNSIYS